METGGCGVGAAPAKGSAADRFTFTEAPAAMAGVETGSDATAAPSTLREAGETFERTRSAGATVDGRGEGAAAGAETSGAGGGGTDGEPEDEGTIRAVSGNAP